MRRTTCRSIATLLICLQAMGCRGQAVEPGAAAEPRDFTFFVISDPHIGVQEKEKPTRTTEQIVEEGRRGVAAVLGLIGKALPSDGLAGAIGPGRVGRPRGLLIAGDLTDNLRWDAFQEVFPTTGIPTEAEPLDAFACFGNHDGNPDGPVRRGLVDQNRAYWRAGKLSAISDNGVHFALCWQGVHLLGLSPCPADSTDEETPFRFGQPGPGSWNDPQGALRFLQTYLAEKVGQSGDPVILVHHYGFDGFSTNDWNWWTPKQRRALYDAIKDYNIVAFIHGHNHHAARYRWPDPQQAPDEVRRLFGDPMPDDVRSYDVFSWGRLCWVFRFVNDQMIAAHYGGEGRGWNPALHFVKTTRQADRSDRGRQTLGDTPLFRGAPAAAHVNRRRLSREAGAGYQTEGAGGGAESAGRSPVGATGHFVEMR